MGTHHSKEKSSFRLEASEFELKLSTLTSYLSYQIEKVRKSDIPSLEAKLAEMMTASKRSIKEENIFAASVFREHHHLQLIEAVSQACAKLLKNFEAVEMLNTNIYKVPSEILLALERILYLAISEKSTSLGYFVSGLRELFKSAFGSQILEELEKFQRLSAKEDLNAFQTANYPGEKVSYFLVAFARERRIPLVPEPTSERLIDKALSGKGHTKGFVPSEHHYYYQQPQKKDDDLDKKPKYEYPGLQYQPPQAYAKQLHPTELTVNLYQHHLQQPAYDPYKKYPPKHEGYHPTYQPQYQKYDQGIIPSKKYDWEKQIPRDYKKEYTTTTQKKNRLLDIAMTASTLTTSPFINITKLQEPLGLSVIREEKYKETFGATPKKTTNPIQQLAQHLAKARSTKPKQDEGTSKKGFIVSFLDNINKIPKLDEDFDKITGLSDRNPHNREQPGFTKLFSKLSEEANIPMLVSVSMRPSLKHFYDPDVIKFLDRKREELRKTGKKFTDSEFPPDASSIGYSRDFMSGKKLTWNRLDASWNSQVTLFDQIRPDVLKQGALGDCYLLCGIVALTEIPEFLKRLIYPREICNEGIYAVTLCDSGAWRTVIIDDFVPFSQASSKPAFSRHVDGDNGIWIPLIEKAYAKIFKSYQAIESGGPTKSLNSLTGAPTEFLNLQDDKFLQEPNKGEAVWEYLQKMQNAGHLSIASSTDDQMAQSKLPLKQKGIVEDHAYTVLGIIAIRTESRSTEKLIKLRNPWGRMEWNGDWSDNSPKWTAYTKAQVGGVISKDDGVFYMSLRDLIKCFSDITTCKFHPKYNYSFLKIEGKYQREPRNVSVIKFTVRKRMPVYLSLFQKEKRHFKSLNKQYDYSPLRANVVKINPDSTSELEISEFICGDFQAKYCLTLENALDPGHYLIVAEAFWEQSVCNDLVIGGYAEEQIQFEDYSVHKYKYNRILAQMTVKFVKACIDKNDLGSIREFEYRGAPGVKRYNSFRLDGFWFCYFQNQSTNSWIEETFQVKVDPFGAAEVVYPPNHSESLIFENRLGPGQETLILLKINGDSLNISFDTSFKVKTQ